MWGAAFESAQSAHALMSASTLHMPIRTDWRERTRVAMAWLL